MTLENCQTCQFEEKYGDEEPCETCQEFDQWQKKDGEKP